MRLKPIEGHLGRLLLLNLFLQLFDGIATYQGLRIGFHEANPLLVAAFGHLGIGTGLLVFKAQACALLLVVYQTAPIHVGIPVMRMLALVYCLLSLGPWTGKFVHLAVTTL